MPPTDAPTDAAPAVSNDSGDRAIQVVPSTSENLATENVPGFGVDNPPQTDFSAANQRLFDDNILKDMAFYDSAAEGVGGLDVPQAAPVSPERRQEIDSVKSRVSDSSTNAMDHDQQDRFFGSAIDSARSLTTAKPEDRQKTYDSAMNSVPPEQRETYNKAIGAALRDQGSNLRTANAPPVGLLLDSNAPARDQIVGRSAIVESPENFQKDQNALESARKVSDAVNTTLSDVPENQRQAIGTDMGNILATQERNGLFAPIKDVGARERPADLASPEAQASKLKGQLPPETGTEPVIKSAVEAANAIAFAKPEDMNKAFNAGMDSLRAAGVNPSSAAAVLSQALNNVSKDLRVSTDHGSVDQSFLHDARLATPANPSGTIGVADRRTAPGDSAENHALFARASEVATAIRSANTDALGRNPTKTAVSEHVDRTFQMLRYYR